MGILAVALLYGMIAYAGLRTARKAATRYAKLLATGLTSLILCQGILNIFVVLGIAPLTGVPLRSSPTRRAACASCWPRSGCCSTSPGQSGEIAPGSRRQPRDKPAGKGRLPVSGPRIVIGAGGTAGHVVPALAVADALRAEGAEVHFVGGERAEASQVPEAGYPFHALRMVASAAWQAAGRSPGDGGRRQGRRWRPAAV